MSLDLGLFLLRLVVGGVLVGHGAQKLFGWFGGPGLAGATGFFGAHLRLRPAAFWALVEGVAADLLEPPVSIARVLLDPRGLAPRIANLDVYAWHVIERKYLDMFARLDADGGGGRAQMGRMEREPGWLDRRRRVLAPAIERLAALPAGPVVEHVEHVA